MPQLIDSDLSRRRINPWAASIATLSAALGLLLVSPNMNAETQTTACSLQVIRTLAEHLYQYQLHLRCPDNGETVHYTLEVIKEGKSGSSRNRQSGSIKLDHPQLMLGNLRLNTRADDTVTVTGSITDLQNRTLAEVTQHFAEQPGG